MSANVSKRNAYEYEVLTPQGFKFFSQVQKVQRSQYLKVSLSNKKIIKCSLNHIFLVNQEEVKAHTLKVGDKVDSIQNIHVTGIEHVNEEIPLYDLISVNGDSTYITNDVVSHNCDASFISSGNSVIPGELLKYYEDTFVEDPIEKRGFDGNLWIWKYVDYQKDYIVCADVARGDSNDFSACHVLDVESLEQVAEYRGKIGTTEYGNFLVSLATEYNNALLVIENANVGWAVCQVAIDRKYENLFYTYKNDPYMDENKHLKKAFDLVDKSKMVPGFVTSARTRPLLVSKLELYFQERSVIVHSIRTINEAYVFIWKNGKPQAQEGYHDDLMMSLGIGLWIRDTALKLRQRGIELNRKGMTNVHRSVLTSNYDQSAAASAWRVQSGKGDSEDITWLL